MPLEQIPACSGDWEDNRLDCSVTDLLFSTDLITQALDWQNFCFIFHLLLLFSLCRLAFAVCCVGSSACGTSGLGGSDRSTGALAAVSAASVVSVDAVPVVLTPRPSTLGAKSDIDCIGTAREIGVVSTPPCLSGDEIPSKSRPSCKCHLNTAQMLHLAAFVVSACIVFCSAIEELVVSDPEGFLEIENMYAQGFSTQWLPKGVRSREEHLVRSLVYSVVSVLVTVLSTGVLRLLLRVLKGINLQREATRCNVAAAIVEGSLTLCSAMVVSGAITGPPVSLEEDALRLAFFYVLSSVCLSLNALLFACVASRLKLWPEVRQGNETVAISFAGSMIAFASVLSNAVFVSDELANIVAWASLGSLALLFLGLVLDKIVGVTAFAKHSQNHVSVDRPILEKIRGPVFVSAALQIASGRVIGSLLPSRCADYKYDGDVTASKLPLTDKLMRTDFTREALCWDKLLALVFILVVCWISRFSYFVPCLIARAWERRWTEVACRERSGVVNDEVQLGAIGDEDAAPLISDSFGDFSVDKDFAASVSFAGYAFGTCNLLVSAFGESDYGDCLFMKDPGPQFVAVVSKLAVGMSLMTFCQTCSIMLVLRGEHKAAQLANAGNCAVAMVEAGVCVCCSFIITACLHSCDYDDRPENLEKLIFARLILFCTCLVLLFLFQLGFEASIAYDSRREILAGNRVAALGNVMPILAAASALYRAVYLSESIVTLVVWSLATFAAILLFRKLSIRLLLPDVDLDESILTLVKERPEGDRTNRESPQGDWGTASVSGALVLSLTLLLNTFLRDCVFEDGFPQNT
eukprot:TRINITY_DN55762_c0_g1_i1.p1 TRINITY_DN55762_c0_g1~~TRINITY_DN55762_c0_g1_i1.p1  ORF type:complete len:807 (-),score=73.01 TRINITY_DN55762_c0_g1_i1:106-2526(-)